MISIIGGAMTGSVTTEEHWKNIGPSAPGLRETREEGGFPCSLCEESRSTIGGCGSRPSPYRGNQKERNVLKFLMSRELRQKNFSQSVTSVYRRAEFSQDGRWCRERQM